MKRTLKILTSTLTAGLLVWGLAQALAEEPRVTKRFPPYPDVWGIELPYPRPGDRNAISGLFRTDDGDITITTIRATRQSPRADGTCCDLTFDFGRVDLFKQRSIAITGRELDAFGERNHATRVSLMTRRLALPDGKVVVSRIRSHNCFSFGENGLEVHSAGGDLLRHVLLYYVGDETINFPQKSDCEAAGGASFVRIRAREIAPIPIALEDGTFLVHDFQGNVVLRFDANFNTKFPLDDRVFILERREFDVLYAPATKATVLTQALHDALLRYLLQRRIDRKESR